MSAVISAGVRGREGRSKKGRGLAAASTNSFIGAKVPLTVLRPARVWPKRGANVLGPAAAARTAQGFDAVSLAGAQNRGFAGRIGRRKAT